ncbi:MAG: HAD family phosphatase [Patescibacteria group bacterium]|jgi:HAD superfamily hydrolase (TIGR01509 family)
MEKSGVIIFDLDGVLVNSEPLWEKAGMLYLRRHGVRTTSKAYRTMTNRYFRGAGVLAINRFIKKTFKIAQSGPEMYAEKIRITMDVLNKELRPMPFALQTIKRLAKIHRLALVSSGPLATMNIALKKLPVRKYFSLIMTGEDVKTAKPNPTIFLKAAKRLRVRPASCVVIEDSVAGVTAAKRAGMLCIVLKTKYTLPVQLQHADDSITRLSELPHLLHTL